MAYLAYPPMITCARPDISPRSGYSWGCRCDRCKQGRHKAYLERKAKFPYVPKTPKTLAERLLANINETSSGCVLWSGPKNAYGYGMIEHRKTRYLTHRLLWELQNGGIPQGFLIDHRCGIRLCCNPEHLQVVTPEGNAENRSGTYSNSGFRGVSWSRHAKKWMVSAKKKGKSYHGGYFDDVDEANQAAIALRNKLMTNNLGDR